MTAPSRRDNLIPMKYRLPWLVAAWVLPAILQAAPQFWSVPNATATPLPAPDIEQSMEPAAVQTATPTPVMAPAVQVAPPTPTPRPGLNPKNPTQAALFSAVVPGAGEVYAGDPVKGVAFAALFGLGLWQTLDNLQLVPDVSGGIPQTFTNNQNVSVRAKNETAGNLFGLATLAVYGFGIQDAYNSAATYNKNNYLTLNFGIGPHPNASLAYRF